MNFMTTYKSPAWTNVYLWTGWPLRCLKTLEVHALFHSFCQQIFEFLLWFKHVHGTLVKMKRSFQKILKGNKTTTSKIYY